VPEGVETAAQLKRVGALACDYVQGFHLCRPLPASQLQARLAPGIREALPERPATKLGTESAVVA
jgi:EAL domain-containing protein (putative c-di-GMP-specific phosphodiesterase class I)